tara:strand:- start:67 stop:297 length:231 start_codon:yes stop_codon:yes gene_type:complete
MQNVVSVTYKGASYMVVQGSDRERFLREANSYWMIGNEAMCRDLHALALASPGCAFVQRDETQTYENWCLGGVNNG